MTDSHCPARSDAAQRILDAAERLFGERGYEGVSIRDIAAAAGISKATVFHHFANKWELYRAVVEGCSDSFRHLVEGIAAHEGPAPTQLGEFAREHLRRTLDRPCATRLFLRQLLDTQDADGRALMEQRVASNLSLAAEALERLRQQGRLPDHVEPHALALTVLGSHLAYFLLQDVLPRREGAAALADPEHYHRAMLDLLLRGLAT